jgi:hypothetical protein
MEFEDRRNGGWNWLRIIFSVRLLYLQVLLNLQVAPKSQLLILLNKE